MIVYPSSEAVYSEVTPPAYNFFIFEIIQIAGKEEYAKVLVNSLGRYTCLSGNIRRFLRGGGGVKGKRIGKRGR